MKVCDDMEETSKTQLNFVFSKKYALTERVINQVCESIKKTYGLEVMRVDETQTGYVFISKHGYTIGDLTYDPHTGLYKKFNFHVGVIERETEANKKDLNEQRYKKFKLQRRRMVGRLTAAALAALFALGALRAIPKSSGTKEPVAVVEQHINSIDTADDLILVSWANYAMGEITDQATESPYDYVHDQRDSLYSSFSNIMINYYNYVDQIESVLPRDISEPLIDKYHNEFRRAVVSYDEEVANSMFSSEVFNASPYADAIVLDTNGMELNKGSYTGEVVGANNNVVLLNSEDTNYNVYVPANDVGNVDYSLEYLPVGSVVYNGEVYVTDDNLSDTNTDDVEMVNK